MPQAAPSIPAGSQARNLKALRVEIAACRRCPLYRNAIQAVCGEGRARAPLMLVGEQPGDQEDKAGKPFVGPAGVLLDRALAEAQVDRSTVFITNAVKHFKNEPRGKRRLHKRPNGGEVRACRWWLTREIQLVKPRLVLALGATAAASLFQKSVVLARLGSEIHEMPEARVMVTAHPSAILRPPDPTQRDIQFQALVAALKRARAAA